MPGSEKSLMSSDCCWIVHYRALRNLLAVTEVSHYNTAGAADWSVDFTVDLDIVNCMTV